MKAVSDGPSKNPCHILKFNWSEKLKTWLINISKLEKGIDRALEKRPIPTVMVEQISNDIEDQAIKIGKDEREISTAELGELVLEKLFDIDKVAYIRFASVYKHFEDLDEFITEVKNINKRDATQA